MHFSFNYPSNLFFAFLIPLTVFLHFFGLKNLRGNSLKFANFKAIARIKGVDLYSKNILPLILNLLIVTLLVLSVSGITFHKEMKLSDFSFVLAIDNSYSMTANDLKPNRLEAAKQTALDFVDVLPQGSELGIVSFSGESLLVSRLSKDKDLLKTRISEIQVSPIQGTDIFDSIKNSAEILKKERNRAVIVLSDGQINVGNLNDLIEFARATDLMIHTIGIGTSDGGNFSYGFSKVDEEGLKGVSYSTNGKYFSVNTNQNLKESFDEIIVVTKREGSIDLAPYFLILVMFIFFIKQYLESINKIVF